MTQISQPDLAEVNPSQYTYQARFEGDGQGGFIGMLYPHGEGWIGREVGQRTLPFRGDFPNKESSVNVSRDAIYPTKESVLERLAQQDLGFPELPTWIAGSARAYTLDPINGGQLFPDDSLFQAVADLLYIGDATPLLKSAALSSDPTFGLDTGPATPRVRQVYWLDGNLSEYQLGVNLIANGKTVRAASSYWDFATSTDPVYLPVESELGLALRNIGPTTTLQITLPASGVSLDLYDLPLTLVSGLAGGPILEDAEATFIWAGTQSLSDTTYLPSARAVGIAPAGYDLAGRLGYPVPFIPELLYGNSTTPGSWSTNRYPFGISNPANATTYIIVPIPGNDYYDVSVVSGGVIGRAHLMDARNGWDRAGEFIGFGRKTGESDQAFAGRQQRLWLFGLQSYLSGSIPRSNRVLCAALGQTQIVETWRGQTINLPPDVTGLDMPSSVEGTIRLSLSTGDLFPLVSLPTETGLQASNHSDLWQGAFITPSTSGFVEYDGNSITAHRVFKCRENLLAYRSILVTVNGITQMVGRDYLISVEDPSVIVFSKAIPTSGVVVQISLAGRQRFKLTTIDDASSAYSNWRLTRFNDEFDPESLASTYRSLIGQNESALREGRTQIADDPTGFPATGAVADTIPGDFYSPAIISHGPRVKSLSQVADRRLYTPGRLFLTQLGQGLLGTEPPTPTWSSTTEVPELIKIMGILTDVEEPPYIP